MNRKISFFLIAAGIALLLVAGGLFVYNRIYDYSAGQRAQDLLDEIMLDFDWDLPPIGEMNHLTGPGTSGSVGGGGDSSEAVERSHPIVVKPQGNFSSDSDDSDGQASSGEWVAPSYSVIGFITIPKLGVQLPVLSESSSTLLNISCCRLSGLVIDKPNRLVIAGHNLKSHFGGLDTLIPGDEIAFTTIGGATYYYSAYEISSLHKTEGADVLAADGWDITLLTCKTDRTMRTMVRFAEIVDESAADETSDETPSGGAAPDDTTPGTAPDGTTPGTTPDATAPGTADGGEQASGDSAVTDATGSSAAGSDSGGGPAAGDAPSDDADGGG